MSVIDWTKPIQTREGMPARVLCSDLKGPKPIAVAFKEGTEEVVCRCYPDGKMFSGSTVEYDIVNVPEKKVAYLNFYPSGMPSVTYSSRAEADAGAYLNRVACIRVEYTVGRYDD